jgi:ABC-type phosphate/phosphonate transport system permease subunit
MATVEARTAENHTELRRELARERQELVRAVEELRHSRPSVASAVRARLPLTVAAAFVIGFVVAGGIGGTARLAFRRGRERRTLAAFGPFALVER